MATTLELMLFYYPNATCRSDVTYAKELVDKAGKIFAPYDIKLQVWPPNCDAYRENTSERIASASWFNDNPKLMDGGDLNAIANPIAEKYIYSLVKRLMVVGRFGDLGLDGREFADYEGLEAPLKSVVFVNTRYPDYYDYKDNKELKPEEKKRSTLAHELGHAAGLKDRFDSRENLMHGRGHERDLNPTLCDIDAIALKMAFFAR